MKIFLPFVLLVASIATLVYSLYVDSASRPRQEFAPAFDGEGIPGLTITRFTAEWHAEDKMISAVCEVKNISGKMIRLTEQWGIQRITLTSADKLFPVRAGFRRFVLQPTEYAPEPAQCRQGIIEMPELVSPFPPEVWLEPGDKHVFEYQSRLMLNLHTYGRPGELSTLRRDCGLEAIDDFITSPSKDKTGWAELHFFLDFLPTPMDHGFMSCEYQIIVDIPDNALSLKDGVLAIRLSE